LTNNWLLTAQVSKDVGRGVGWYIFMVQNYGTLNHKSTLGEFYGSRIFFLFEYLLNEG